MSNPNQQLPPILCVRVDQVDGSVVLPRECQPLPCSGCGRSCIGFPSTRNAVAAGTMRAVCSACFGEEAARTGKTYSINTTPAGAEELLRAIKDIERAAAERN